MLRGGKRAAVSVSSWFCIPEQGMKDFEILSRASGFLVPAQAQYRKQFHIVTCSHSISPWRWPKYYPMDWLQHVNEKHTYYTLEVRHDDGSFATQLELQPTSFHHKNRDVAALHLENEKDGVKLLENLGYDPLSWNFEFLHPQDELYFSGHELVGQIHEDGTDERKPVPRLVGGCMTKQTENGQNFGSTGAKVLSDGMCGGPVLTSNSTQVVGMVEGIVPLDSPHEGMRGKVAFIDTTDICCFLEMVEGGDETYTDCLRGGEVAEMIGRDQDPSKLNLKRMIELEEERRKSEPKDKD